MIKYTVFQKSWTSELMVVTLPNLKPIFNILSLLRLSDKFARKVIVKDPTTS